MVTQEEYDAIKGRIDDVNDRAESLRRDIRAVKERLNAL